MLIKPSKLRFLKSPPSSENGKVISLQYPYYRPEYTAILLLSLGVNLINGNKQILTVQEQQIKTNQSIFKSFVLFSYYVQSLYSITKFIFTFQELMFTPINYDVDAKRLYYLAQNMSFHGYSLVRFTHSNK